MRVMSRALILAAASTGVCVGLAVVRAADPPAPPTTPPATALTTTTPASLPALPAPPAPPAAPNEKIEAAIRQLSADTWKQRQAAQDTLVSFGDDAVPRLRELDASNDEEVRTRAAAALAQIEQNAQFGGSVVTLKMPSAKPEAVFAELGRQAKCDFPVYPANLWQQARFSQPISVDLERVPFWTAFREACTKSGVFPQQYGSDRRMSLTQGSIAYWNGPSVISGPFLVVANRIYRSDSIDLANPAAVQRDFQVTFTTFVEPKIRVIQSSYNVRIDEAVDDKGNSLLVKERMPEGMSSGQQWMWNLNARLNYPADAGKQIVRLRGGMRFLVQTKAETLDVPDILKVKNLEQKVAGRRVLIKEVKAMGDTYEVQMTVYRDGMSPGDWNMMSYPGSALRLVDKNGKQLTPGGWNGGGGMNEMTYNWHFNRNTWGGVGAARPDEPHRLVWEIPTETREMTAEFAFKDLPMP